MTGKTVIHEKSLDYVTAYADGIIFEYGNNGVSRLIFYQKEPQISEDGKEFDRIEEIKRLKFEVRIPQIALGNISQNVQYRQGFQDKTLKLVQDTKDEKIISEFINLSKEVSEILFDSDSFASDSPNARVRVNQ